MRTADGPTPPAVPSAAKARIIDAALRLFATHGVGGTSLQMIADEIGVTKAAVYHQYPTKDEIVLAAAEFELDQVRVIVEEAEAEPDVDAARAAAVAGIVALAIERRRTTSTILSDPVIASHFARHSGFQDVMSRLRRLLLGDDNSAAAKVRTAMLVAALSGAANHPFVAELDDEVVRDQLGRLAKAFLTDD